MELYVIRHGQTDWNVQYKVMGRKDIPLNKIGKQEAFQAKLEADKIDYDLVIYSPLLRAKETAEIINKEKNIKMIPEDFLLEREFGEYEGFKKSEFDFEGFWDYEKNIKYERAENIRDFFERIYKGLDNIKERYNAKQILVVCHAGVGIAIDCYFNGF
jgi:broad specificity phosphatase PhoE